MKKSLFCRILGTNLSSRNADVLRQSQANATTFQTSVGASTGSTYLKSVNLLINGRPMQSLTLEPATLKENYGQFYLFAKTTGCVNSGKFKRYYRCKAHIYFKQEFVFLSKSKKTSSYFHICIFKKKFSWPGIEPWIPYF